MKRVVRWDARLVLSSAPHATLCGLQLHQPPARAHHHHLNQAATTTHFPGRCHENCRRISVGSLLLSYISLSLANAKYRRRWDILFNHNASSADLKEALRSRERGNPCEEGLRSVCWKVSNNAILSFSNSSLSNTCLCVGLSALR